MTRETRALLAGAGACAGAFVALLVIAYGSNSARWADATALGDFIHLQPSAIWGLPGRVVDLGDPGPVVVLATVLALIALARRRPRAALFVVALVGITSVSSQLLKELLAFPRPEGITAGGFVQDEAFPSGHATASMSLALAALVVAPARLRAVTAVGGALFALAVSYSLMAVGGHFPSDILGGFLLAALTALVLLAVFRPARGDEPALPAMGSVAARLTVVRPAAALAAAIVASAVLAGLLALGPDRVLGLSRAHTSFVAVGGVLVLSALGLVGALAGAVGRWG